jgi:hypothetical protein
MAVFFNPFHQPFKVTFSCFPSWLPNQHSCLEGKADLQDCLREMAGIGHTVKAARRPQEMSFTMPAPLQLMGCLLMLNISQGLFFMSDFAKKNVRWQ